MRLCAPARASTLDCIGTLFILLVIVRGHCRRRDLSNQSPRLLFLCRQPASGRSESELCRVQRTLVDCACVFVARNALANAFSRRRGNSLARLRLSASAELMFKSFICYLIHNPDLSLSQLNDRPITYRMAIVECKQRALAAAVAGGFVEVYGIFTAFYCMHERMKHKYMILNSIIFKLKNFCKSVSFPTLIRNSLFSKKSCCKIEFYVRSLRTNLRTISDWIFVIL